MANFIAYYRVSTDRQGASGLGERSSAHQPSATLSCSCGMPEAPRRAADCSPGPARPQRRVHFGSDGERHGFYCL